jgi:hypothetical protein
MKSRFMIFTLVLAVIWIGSAGNAIAQSATGTGVFTTDSIIGTNNNIPLTATVSARQGGNGGVLRLGEGQSQIIAQPVDICVQDNAAFVVGQITHVSGEFAGLENGFLNLGFVDNGKDGDFLLISIGTFTPEQLPACLFFTAPNIPVPLDRGSYQVKP